MAGACWIGTSGWVYPDWQPAFYPAGWREADWLAYYARHFDTVELNRSFYRLPTREDSARWAALTPPGFRFAVKASRYLTHMKKLKDPQEPLARLLDVLAPLGSKLGPLLIQLPPRWRFDAGRLSSFLQALPRDQRWAIEFRDPSWFHPAAYELLERHGVALCVTSFPGLPVVWQATAAFTYVRLHGTTRAYDHDYTPQELRPWAGQLRQVLARGQEAHVYFDNDVAARAIANARTLRAMLAGSPLAER